VLDAMTVEDPPACRCSVGRYYDPQTGQFISVDPLVGDTGQPYAYANGDPVDTVDPNGLWPCLQLHCLAGGVASVGATVVHYSPVGQTLDIASHALHKTVGICASGDVFAGADIHGSVCYVSTPSGQTGLTVSVGVGFGAPYGVSSLLGPEISNAQRLSDLGGPFAFASASAGRGPFGAGAFGEAGENSCGRTIWVAGGGWAPSLRIAPTPFSYAGGLTNTLTFSGF